MNRSAANAAQFAQSPAESVPVATALSDLAHELANPLNAIAITNELAKRMLARGQYEQVARALDAIGADCDRCGRLLRDAQDFFSMEIGEVCSEIDLSALLEEAAQPLSGRGEIERRDTPSQYLLRGDARALRRLFSELLRNAFDHGARRVQIDTSGDGRQVCLRFRDDGPGIDPAVLPRIFDPFFSTERERHSGTGLALARKVAQAHGGTVDTEHSERGAALRVKLPVSERP